LSEKTASDVHQLPAAKPRKRERHPSGALYGGGVRILLWFSLAGLVTELIRHSVCELLRAIYTD
jgi:hypothetical protein